MNHSIASARSWTYAELVAELPESNQPMELWDGKLLIWPTPSFAHQQVVFRFHDELKRHVRSNTLGKTISAPMDMVLAPSRAVQPDVMFISSAKLSLVNDRLMGAADLVAEVISPTSRQRDRIEKRNLYEQHGVQEYWLIDPEAQTVEVLHLEKGAYSLVGRSRPGEVAQSRLLAGFTVPVAALFAAQ